MALPASGKCGSGNGSAESGKGVVESGKASRVESVNRTSSRESRIGVESVNSVLARVGHLRRLSR